MTKEQVTQKKIAVAVVGGHYAGKSKTIKVHVKPQLGLRQHDHKFWLHGRKGWISSQSFEEAERDVAESLNSYRERGFDLLVVACRPAYEGVSVLQELRSCSTAAGYEFKTVEVAAGRPETYYRNKASEVVALLMGLEEQ